ncbi:hypothetical protein XENORESO_017036 [Xenotaenia resolanae]|uniref:Uncharacterized protein n=1 Tax=Xenotaenia resolanae TaxID=208358 RepID=A0ABV0WH42_9TELE
MRIIHLVSKVRHDMFSRKSVRCRNTMFAEISNCCDAHNYLCRLGNTETILKGYGIPVMMITGCHSNTFVGNLSDLKEHRQNTQIIISSIIHTGFYFPFQDLSGMNTSSLK